MDPALFTDGPLSPGLYRSDPAGDQDRWLAGKDWPGRIGLEGAIRLARENLRKTGSEMEGEAAAYLEAQGVHILEKNYRTREAEIDLIGMQGRTLVFVEVKARQEEGKSGTGAEAVGPSKQRRICRCADFYMHSKGIDPYSTSIRFDVVEIQMESRMGDPDEQGTPGFEIRWIRDAFPYIQYKRTRPSWRVW